MAAVLFAAVLLLPPPAAAQGLEILGNRAAGLSAFVAVADDASAVAWNPAGLVIGPIFNVLLDFERSTEQPSTAPAQSNGRAGRLGGSLFAFAALPVGLSYYRLRTTAIDASTPAVVGSPDRQIKHVVVRSLVTSNVGVTVLQSMGNYFTVGATARLVRGSAVAGRTAIADWRDGFNRVDALDDRGATRGDLDAGVLATFGTVRAGLVVRNLVAPSFPAAGGEELKLARHARVGVAWGDRWPGTSRTILAVDADLTTVAHPAGNRRDVAAGVERWLGAHRWGVRGGVRVSTVGEARPVVSAGGSLGVRPGTYVDVYAARGRAGGSAWGLAARVTY